METLLVEADMGRRKNVRMSHPHKWRRRDDATELDREKLTPKT